MPPKLPRILAIGMTFPSRMVDVHEDVLVVADVSAGAPARGGAAGVVGLEEAAGGALPAYVSAHRVKRWWV